MTINSLPSDVIVRISRYLDVVQVNNLDVVSKTWSTIMRLPDVWIGQSEKGMIPYVDAERTCRREDYKLISRITYSKRQGACLGEYVNEGERLVISEKNFNFLGEKDPFEIAEYSGFSSAAGSKRTRDQAFSVKKICDTFAVVVEPRFIRRIFEQQLFFDLIGTGAFEIKQGDSFLQRARDVWLLGCKTRKDWVRHDHIQTLKEVKNAFKHLDWDHFKKEAFNRNFFIACETFYKSLNALDEDSYKVFIHSLNVRCKISMEAALGKGLGEKGSILKALKAHLESSEREDDATLSKAFNDLLESLDGDNDDCMLVEALIRVLFGWQNLFPRANHQTAQIQGSQDLIIPYSHNNIEVLSGHALTKNNSLGFGYRLDLDLQDYQRVGSDGSEHSSHMDSAEKVNIYFMRREVPAQSCYLTFEQQQKLVQEHGFQLPFLRSKHFFNVLQALNTSAGGSPMYTRTADLFSKFDPKLKAFQTCTGFIADFLPASGEEDSVEDVEYFGVSNPEARDLLLGAVPCLSVKVQPMLVTTADQRPTIQTTST